ncbi:putative beta-1,3-galactosyltransferase 12 [Camellia lanceoleosa]|uniref:Beta-1,3-galactosyltransferase 12 n=1 Tax=Camellia lanceoleosa TaxID=1840588 RepID=A0ACC0FUQ7_9ERIC|nr:putative beta-1,3-galactosyltransferase 12 [Camellia lanceoleosa]
MPPPHLTPRHAHQSDNFDMEHFGEGPSMGLSPHGPSIAMHTPQTSPLEYTNYTSQFAPEVDPLMSEHISAHHGHILDPSWSPPHIGQRYEKSGHLIGSEYVLHAYGPICVLSAEVVASLAIARNNS